jgi:tetratricopeptide (TPR) repeat protein
MRIRRWLTGPVSVLVLTLAFAAPGAAQLSVISIPAGSPADLELQVIAKEGDAAKQKALYTEFVAKYAADPMASAYAYSQLAQLASAAGDNKQALAYGDKAIAGVPGNLDLYVSQTTFAQAAALNDKAFDYASRGGKLVKGIEEAPKPSDVSEEEFASRKAELKRTVAPAYEFLESSAYAVAAHEKDPKQRMTYIQVFNETFVDSKYEGQVSQLAIWTLQQLNDPAGSVAYGEMVLAQKPDELPVLVMMADIYADEPKGANVAKAVQYAQHAVEVAKSDDADADDARKLAGAIARSALGRALMRQHKMAAAVVELKKAAPVLRSNAQAYSVVLFYLANAYSLQRQYAQAKQVLNEAVGVQGPYQGQARNLLAKVNAEIAKGR